MCIDEPSSHRMDTSPLVHEPTRGKNILNILASDDPRLLSDVLVDDAGLLSDHRLIHSKLCMTRPSCQPVVVTFRRPCDIHLPAFESTLHLLCLSSSPAAKSSRPLLLSFNLSHQYQSKPITTSLLIEVRLQRVKVIVWTKTGKFFNIH